MPFTKNKKQTGWPKMSEKRYNAYMKKSSKLLLVVFLLIATTKIALSFLISGPVIFTDEVCALLRAEHFMKFFELKDCTSLITFPAGDPMPLFSFIISPLYLFLHGIDAYYGALIINSIFISSLVYPIYHLFKKVVKKDWIIIPAIILILFSAPILLYEKLVMTESLFVAVNVWFIYFYVQSFEKNKVRNKIMAVIFSLLATITRPFGFIVPFSLLVNEFFQSKKKKRLFPLIILAALAIFFLLPLQMPGIWEAMWGRFTSIFMGGNAILFLEAIKNQINSYIITTYLIPVVLFFFFLFSKNNNFKKIKPFLLTFILLNFLASMQHLFGYLQQESGLSLLTRYINMSVVYTLIFGIIFFFKEKKFKFTTKRIIIIAILVIPLILLKHSPIKHSLNMDISHYYYTGIGFIESKGFLSPYFIPVTGLFLILLIFQKRRTLTILFVTALIINSVAIFNWEIGFSREEYSDRSWEYFADTNVKILFIQPPYSPTLSYGKIRTLTQNQADITFQPYVVMNAVKDYDYIISRSEIPLKFLGVTNYLEGIYQVHGD